MNKVIITVANKSDIDDWVNARTLLWPKHNTEYHAKEVVSSLNNSSNLNLMARVNNQFVGILEASIRPYANGCQNTPVVFLEGVWVRKEFRQHSIGMKLIEFLENWAIDNNFSEICSDTDIENKIAQTAHIKWGFNKTETVVYFRKEIKS